MNNLHALDQLPFGSDNFAENPEPRCPCVLLLDTSASMQGKAIKELNQGLRGFLNDLLVDPIARKRVELAVVTFGPVALKSNFHTVNHFYFNDLEATGDTPMGEAIQTAINLLNSRKADYKRNGIGYYRPWIILITDGAPTDDYTQAAQLVKQGETDKAFAFFAIGVDGANLQILSQIAVREPQKLQGYKFKEFFVWLSGSMRAVSQSIMGSAVKLLPPTGWAEV